MQRKPGVWIGARLSPVGSGSRARESHRIEAGAVLRKRHAIRTGFAVAIATPKDLTAEVHPLRRRVAARQSGCRFRSVSALSNCCEKDGNNPSKAMAGTM